MVCLGWQWEFQCNGVGTDCGCQRWWVGLFWGGGGERQTYVPTILAQHQPRINRHHRRGTWKIWWSKIYWYFSFHLILLFSSHLTLHTVYSFLCFFFHFLHSYFLYSWWCCCCCCCCVCRIVASISQTITPSYPPRL